MEKAGNIIKIFLQTCFDKAQLKEGEGYHTFFSDWEKIIGSRFFQHSKPIDVKDHFLYLEVDHPGWLQLIQMNEKSIIKRISSLFPQLEVKFLKIKLNTDTFDKPLTKKVENSGKNDDNEEKIDELMLKFKKDYLSK
jgi:hypothetical protein